MDRRPDRLLPGTQDALSDVMVLYRSAYEARPMEAELIRRGIAYRFIGGLVLTKSAHVRDILSLLRLARDPRDDLAWMRFLQIWPRIGERTAQRILGALGTVTPDAVLSTLREEMGTDHLAAMAYEEAVKNFAKPSSCVKAVNTVLKQVLCNGTTIGNNDEGSHLLEKVVATGSRLQFIDDFTLEPMNDTQISNAHTMKHSRSTSTARRGPRHRSASSPPLPNRLSQLQEPRRFRGGRRKGVLYGRAHEAKDELYITLSSFNRNAFWVKLSPAVG